MTVYPKLAYKNPWPNGVPNSSASSRGWGPGWPNCQASKMATIVAQDQTAGENFDIRISVRKEIAQMVVSLMEATDALYDVQQHDTGAYNCRPISGTNTASNHSWGLAIDINWEHNPQGPFHSEIPPAVVAMWIDCGFGWGGFYASAKPDTMHFEYLGTPASVAANTKKAAIYASGNKPAPVPAPSGKLTQKQVIQLAVDAGFSRADANVMSVIAYYESGWDPKNLGDVTLSKYGSRGLWQIFTGAHNPSEVGVGTGPWTAALAIALEDPKANAHAAHVVFKEQGFKAWSTYNNRAQHSGWQGLLDKAAAIDLGGTPTPVPKPQSYVVTLGKNAAPGKTDKTVLDLQRALIAAGFAKGIFTKPNGTGKYGKGTEKAVRAFFNAHPEYQSSSKDTAIGAHGWTFLRGLAIKSGK